MAVPPTLFKNNKLPLFYEHDKLVQMLQSDGVEWRAGHNTTCSRKGTVVFVRYYAVAVAELREGSAKLRSGGWRTVTTMDRINRCIDPLGWYMHSWDWMVYGNISTPFRDLMTVRSDGTYTYE